LYFLKSCCDFLQAGFLSTGKKGSMFSVPDDPSAKVKEVINSPCCTCLWLAACLNTQKPHNAGKLARCM